MKIFICPALILAVVAGTSWLSSAHEASRGEGSRTTVTGGLVFLAQASKPKTTYDFTGSWKGTYTYTLSDKRVTVDFTAVLSTEGGWFSGRISEPNTFGDKTSDKLFANIRGGLMEDGRVIFLKKYDGTAGVSHFVLYEGQLDPRQGAVRGKWSIRQDWWGTFEMAKQNP